MKNSIFIKTIEVLDPRNPGTQIVLDLHDVDGGIIGISPTYAEEESNYILNPYQECQLVKLTDPLGNDDLPDPPLEEDEIVGFLKILKAFDDTCNLLPEESKNIILDGISKRTGLSRDRIDVLLGMAKDTLDLAALAEFTKVLKIDPTK